jgi:diguanylate cyclase (GGDEF)-like protein
MGHARGGVHAGSRRPSLLCVLWAAPVAAAGLAMSVMLLLRTDRLAADPPWLEAHLLAVGLLALAASVAIGCWQQRAIARPLRRLAQADGSAMPEGGLPREVALVRARLEAGERWPAAERDPLTGLLAPMALRAAGPAALEAARAAGHRLLLVTVDIERLRDINAAHGYALGDELLRQVARRLAVSCPSQALTARMGGDRFALLIPLRSPDQDAGFWLSVVAATLQRSFRVGGCELAVAAAGGGALFPEHAAGFQQLLRAADLALEAARRSERRRWHLFDPRLDRAIAAQRAVERELRQALEQGALVLHYQPQVSLASGRVVGVEALLRWPHPERGLIPPQSFIPVAEASGLIRPLGAWVLAEAARAARRWRDRGLEIGVSVNVSAAQLRRHDLVPLVAKVLATTGLPPEALELELTESMFVDPRKLEMHRAVQAVAAMGVRLAIDDFGTGYSSLGYLKRLPVDRIKIDKSFVRELDRNEVDAAIVRSIISLARVFGKRVLAEGVEEPVQRAFLEREGCDEAQGFHFSRPLPEPDCTAFLLSRAEVGTAAPDPEQALAG